MSLPAHSRTGDWIGVRGDRIVVHTGKVDIGQRISTALAQIAHEELTLPPDRIDIAPVGTGRAPDEGVTSGSNSVEQSGGAVRAAAATLRRAAIARAAARTGSAAGQWQLADGRLCLPGSNHAFDLVEVLRDVPPDTPVDAGAVTPGGPRPAPPHPAMRGIGDMVRGRYTFVHDLDRPGMRHARVIRPPHVHARLRGLAGDVPDALRADGFDIVRDGSFLAVAGAAEWPVIRAAQRLAGACDWDPGPGLPETDIPARLDSHDADRHLVVDGTPTADPIPDPSARPDRAARFERPYQLHGSLAPSAALAEWTGETLILHSQSQGIYPLRASIAESLGLAEDRVDITHVPGSGCYGHTGADDAAFEAALIALALPGRPVLLKWSREDEHAWEPFAPAMAVELAAGLTDGRITTWEAEVFSDTHRGRPRPGPDRAGPARLLANRFRQDPVAPARARANLAAHAGMHRNLEPAYDVADKRLVRNLVRNLPHRTSAMRCLGAAANIFALESFMDELARDTGADPLAFRRAHLSDPRARRSR